MTSITGPKRVKLLQVSLLVSLVVTVIWKHYSSWNSQESVANRLCEPTGRNKNTNERNIRNVQVPLIEVVGGQSKDDLRMTLSDKGGRP